jgi:hypothetical protein
MQNKLRNFFIRILRDFPFLRKLLLKVFPCSGLLNSQLLQENFLGDYIQSHYDKETLRQKRTARRYSPVSEATACRIFFKPCSNNTSTNKQDNILNSIHQGFVFAIEAIK